MRLWSPFPLYPPLFSCPRVISSLKVLFPSSPSQGCSPLDASHLRPPVPFVVSLHLDAFPFFRFSPLFPLTEPSVLFYTLGALILLIFLVAIIRNTIYKEEALNKEYSHENFTLFKKALVLVFVLILSFIAVWDLFFWAKDQFLNDPDPIKSVGEINNIFYKEFFTLMIFFDVLILLISLRYTHNYDDLLRNSGFILSTVIMRISMTSPMPYKSFGFVLSGLLCLFFVFIYYQFKTQKE